MGAHSLPTGPALLRAREPRVPGATSVALGSCVRRNAPPNGDVATIVKLSLTGLLGETEAAERLGIGTADLRSLLAQHDLADTAMLPCRVDDELALTYVDIGRDSFAAPRFDDVVERHVRADPPPESAVFRLPARDVLRADAAAAGPAGIIAHVGRCGSTLLCNLLAAGGGWAAIKEPEVINRLLLRRANERDEARRVTIAALVARVLHNLAHGTRRDAAGATRRCAVKLSSWNLLFADAFATAPTTPIVMLSRDPWATVASSLQHLPDWYHAAADMPAPHDRVALARLFATEWSRIVEAALSLPGTPLFVSYDALIADPAATVAAVRRHFGDDRPLEPGMLDAVRQQYSKAAGQEPFDPGGRHRRDGLDDDIRDVVTTITASGWARLREREGNRASTLTVKPRSP